MVTYDNAYYVPSEGVNPALLCHDSTLESGLAAERRRAALRVLTCPAYGARLRPGSPAARVGPARARRSPTTNDCCVRRLRKPARQSRRTEPLVRRDVLGRRLRRASAWRTCRPPAYQDSVHLP